MSVLSAELVHQNAIRRRRTRAARTAMFGTVLQAQLLFWAWVAGWMLGPSPMGWLELVGGATFAFAVGAFVAWPFMKRRIESDLAWSTKLAEGRRKRRFAFFPDYLTIDHEIVLRSSIESAERADSDLRVAYRDPRTDDHVVRLFAGPEEIVSRVKADLAPRPAG